MTERPSYNIPSRLVPDELLPAARLTAREDNFGGTRKFEQGRGPLCFGSQDHQAKNLEHRAKLHANLAAAYRDLAEWIAGADQ